MAIKLTPQGGNADLAGRTVTSLDGFRITYDSTGYARQAVSPDGQTKYFDSLGNQISQPADIQAAQASIANATEQPAAPIEETAEVVTQEQADDALSDTDSATNPSGDVEFPNTQAFDDGSTLQTFEDGSTLAVDTDGNETSSGPTELVSLNAEESSTNEQPEENVDNGIDESAEYTTDSLGNTFKNGSLYRAVEVDDTTGESLNNNTDSSGRAVGIAKGAQPAIPPSAQAQWSEAKDLRVKLRVPNEYLTGKAAGPSNILQKNGGILFPYTPQITMENTANYANQNPLHSNYPLYFYKNSSISPINVTAKFTVQTEFEGAVLLGIIHMLRALTKMKFGNDPDAGSPPPVCRFDAYGDYMMFNVPVAIASWRHELPDNVDYISVGRKGSPQTYGHSMVPTMSTISLTLNPMYSRREMLQHNTKDWLSGGLARRGYL